jgi:hypothetical protein
MTEEQYHSEMVDILSEIPTEFHSFVASYAYELGHSAGREEVINYASRLADEIKEPIKDFEKRLKTFCTL